MDVDAASTLPLLDGRRRRVHGQRLDGQRKHVRLLRGGDLRRGREAGPQFLGGLIERDDDLEVLCLFSAGGRLRSGNAGGAQQRLIADQGHVSLEDLAGHGVDGDIGRLADLDVDDVGLVHLDFGGNDAHIGDGHQSGAFGVLNADDDGLAFADRQVGHDAVKGRDRDGLARARLGWHAAWRPAVCKCPRGRSGSAPWPG